MSENKKELNDRELDEAKGGMKIIITQSNEKIKKYFLEMIEKIKKKNK